MTLRKLLMAGVALSAAVGLFGVGGMAASASGCAFRIVNAHGIVHEVLEVSGVLAVLEHLPAPTAPVVVHGRGHMPP